MTTQISPDRGCVSSTASNQKFYGPLRVSAHHLPYPPQGVFRGPQGPGLSSGSSRGSPLPELPDPAGQSADGGKPAPTPLPTENPAGGAGAAGDESHFHSAGASEGERTIVQMPKGVLLKKSNKNKRKKQSCSTMPIPKKLADHLPRPTPSPKD